MLVYLYPFQMMHINNHRPNQVIQYYIKWWNLIHTWLATPSGIRIFKVLDVSSVAVINNTEEKLRIMENKLLNIILKNSIKGKEMCE
jgi:hypothetical protein